MSTDIKNLGSIVWSIAETPRGDSKQSEYGKVILPLVVLRRLDYPAEWKMCILSDDLAIV
jgi:type I restriction enzyme M protein